MSIKKIIIIALILFLLPGFLGKVSLAPFSDFSKHISFETFKTAFSRVLKDDIAFYTGFTKPWIQKIKDFIKKSSPPINLQTNQ